MKFLLLLLATLGTINLSFADCAASGVYVYPNNSQLSQNGCIFIEGYFYSRPFIEGLGSKFPVTLESTTHKVDCEVVSDFDGMKSLKMVVLKPTELLKVNQTYKLKIGNLEESDETLPFQYDSEQKKSVPYSWKITQAADLVAPKWVSKPTHKENTYVGFGCGPAVYAHFIAQIKDSSPVWVVAELEHSTNELSETYTYPVQVSDYKLFEIGHGMCSGAFTYRTKDSYQVRFKLYDQSANTDNEWTEWISFKNPMDHNKTF